MSTQGPSLLSRATRVFSSTPPPPRPTHWHDSVHGDALVKFWDAIVEVTAKNPQKYGGSSTAIRLAYTYQHFCGKFPKLREGDNPLNTVWMEYVLGKALKPPFCTAEGMGRWEVLAGSSGPRGNWGPW